MTSEVVLRYHVGDAAAFIDALWQHFQAAPEGPLLGAIHLVGDRGQIQIQVNDPATRELVVEPGQILHARDALDPHTWGVTDDRPGPGHWATSL